MARWASPRAARGIVAFSAVAALTGLFAERSPNAHAAPKEAAGDGDYEDSLGPRATVIEIDGGDVILDVGRDSGLAPGDTVELWRPLKLRHPVTGKTLTDRFRIGTLELTQVRPELSLARATGALEREPAPGDVIVYRSRATAPPPSPGEPASEAQAAPAPADLAPDAAHATEMMVALRGASISARVRAYDDFVRRFPESAISPTLYEESQALRRLYALSRSAPDAGAVKVDGGVEAVAFESPRDVMRGEPLTVGIELSAQATGAVIHLRRPSSPAYVSVPMKPMGAGYFAATIPQSEIVAPSFQFFIEATGPDGRPTAVVGDERSPDSIRVMEPPGEEKKSEILATIALITDYADYNRLRGDDRVWQTEGSFGMRFSDTGLRALRSGFGVYRGVGGSVEELDELSLEPRDVGLTYGYVETEAAPIEALAFIGRGVVGLGDDGVTGGGQLLVRIGHDQRTNLLLGGELLGSVGLRSIAQLELNSFERFPIMLRTEVTNQPAGASPSEDDGTDGVARDGGEIGARGIAQLGFRVVDELVIAARGSFQGRTIEHAGPGVGGAVSYTW